MAGETGDGDSGASRPIALGRIAWPLAVGETLVWAAMFYSFPALLPAWEEALGWSKTELSGAFTAALVTTALLAPVVGRIIDRGYGVRVLTGSALLGGFGLAFLAGVDAVWQFYGAWLLIGVAMAGALYEACFAILTKTLGAQRKQAITIVTLVAGFAGTLSFPGNYLLTGWLGWRGAVLVQAGIVALIAAPLLWLGASTAQTRGTPHRIPPRLNRRDARSILGNPIFWLLALCFAMIALGHSLILTHLLPILDERSIPEGAAVIAAALIGPMQVVGRFGMLQAEQRVSSLGLFVACFCAMGLAIISLLAAGLWPWLTLSFVIFQGAGYGVTSILRPVFTADLLGFGNFGLIAGLLALPFQGAAAVAPTIAAFIWGAGGYNLVILCALATVAIGLSALLAAAARGRHGGGHNSLSRSV